MLRILPRRELVLKTTFSPIGKKAKILGLPNKDK
jgi:hypothetical protein